MTLTSPYFNQRLGVAERTRTLDAIVARSVHRGGQRPVVVFDLDGTLMDNRPRVVAILHELADAWRRKHPDAAALIARAAPEHIGWGFEDNLRRLGVVDRALHAVGVEFWRSRFFADFHMRHDVPIPGACEYVRDCYAAGAIIVYLTGRDLPNMALGSFASLRDLGFPIGVIGTELVVKPTSDMADTDFKREVAPDLARLGRVIATFDNEPANCNLMLEAHPDSEAIFVDTQYAPDPPPLHPRVSVICSFERAP